jgi:hypothetical protein
MFTMTMTIKVQLQKIKKETLVLSLKRLGAKITD